MRKNLFITRHNGELGAVFDDYHELIKFIRKEKQTQLTITHTSTINEFDWSYRDITHTTMADAWRKFDDYRDRNYQNSEFYESPHDKLIDFLSQEFKCNIPDTLTHRIIEKLEELGYRKLN